MQEKCTLIEMLTKSIPAHANDEEIKLKNEMIQIEKRELEQLWKEQLILEQKLDNPNIRYVNKQCT